ncbi:DUF805 domain-containing protein [Mesorhizobium sp. LSJC264A00]|uniref:DUF805 domain-containing protein n=1 Tax=unclassified Mesorhizobium TaxID=325217 RepID=UPI0003CF5AC6|nr:DUF805 domain-containing protein [Mesorhizobium sp. LSJC264A00]ESX15675.1 hypothetical protein X767_28010 [Mesorhizobium sp. LSJC264A00]
MRGEVLHYDEAQGFGFITGADGNRYTFAREDLRRDTVIANGAVVEFLPASGQARDVFSIRAQPASPATAAPAASVAPPKAAAASAAPQHFGRLAEDGAVRDSGLPGYFWRGVTRNYINFAERARRKEFWGYCLFWTVSFILVGIAGALADQAVGNFDAGNWPIVMIGVWGLFWLATFLPWVGLVVRRLHDIGLTGWLAIPYFAFTFMFAPATLILALILGLIPTQAHENQWGPVPGGGGA